MIGSGASLARSRPITGLFGLWHTSVGKKFVMALSGFILFGYLVLHLWGNLKIFESREAVNTWGVFLREFGDPVLQREWILWVVRLILLAAVLLHIWAAVALTRQDLKARPVAYALRRNQESTYASRTMRWGGVLIALFIVYHVLHLTVGSVHGRFHHGDIYNNVVYGFLSWPVSLVYIVTMVAIGLHVYHGVWSMFQTLGLNTARTGAFFRGFATFFAVALTIGNLAIPVAVLAGLLRPIE